VDELFKRAGVETRQLDRVFLAGGSSFMPAERRIFIDRFGQERIRGSNGFTPIVHELVLLVPVSPAMMTLHFDKQFRRRNPIDLPAVVRVDDPSGREYTQEGSVKPKVDFEGDPDRDGLAVAHCWLESGLHYGLYSLLVEARVETLYDSRILRSTIGAHDRLDEANAHDLCLPGRCGVMHPFRVQRDGRRYAAANSLQTG